MSRRLLQAGYPVTVYDINQKAMVDLAEGGAETGSSPEKVAQQSSVTITMLPASPEVEAVILGPEGVLDGTGDGDIVIDMSSSYPMSTKMIGEKLAAKGVRMLDAPVSGGVPGASEGTLTIIAGGEEKDYTACLPLFKAMGHNIWHVGELGSGHALKALNNLCSACSMIITSEAMVTATKLGLAPETVIDIINQSTGRSWSSQYKFPTFILNDAFNSGFSIGLLSKDVSTANRLARELHTPMLVGSIVEQLYNYAAGRGSPDDCHTTIVKLFEEWTDVKVRSREGG
jgi:3-hydroxyisobutyrate dehydrogenase-like beta-hydroxyacid dehydrogenase